MKMTTKIKILEETLIPSLKFSMASISNLKCLLMGNMLI